MKRAGRIILITRQLNPPWDEASKNIGFNIAANSKKFHYTILTYRENQALKNATQLKTYSSNKFTTFQKLRLVKIRKHMDDHDIVHFMFTPTRINTLLYKFLTKNKKIKTIKTVANPNPHSLDKARAKQVLSADAVIAYSDYSEHKLEKLGIDNIKRINPGIDTRLYKKNKRTQSDLKKLRLSINDFVVVYPGEYANLGATDSIVSAIIGLAKEIPRIKMVFACRIKTKNDVIKKTAIDKLFLSNGISRNIVHTGTVENMQALYTCADVVLFPINEINRKFVVPLVVLEAMACETPIVASNIPELAEFTNKSNAYICRPGDATKIKSHILDIYTNPTKAKMIAKNARKAVLKSYSLDRMVNDHEILYTTLLND